MRTGVYGPNVDLMTTTVETSAATKTVRRINLNRVAPEFYEAMLTLSAAAAKGLDPALAELIKIRASQLNHCAFCLDMHTRDARKIGVGEQKLDVLAAWSEAGDLFNETERAALALTEAITELGHGGVPDDVYEDAAGVFSDRELGQVIAMAVTINAWNRINVTVRTPPAGR